MKIVFLNVSGAFGGAERCLFDIVVSLRRATPDVQIHAVFAEDGPILQDFRELGIDVSVLPMRDALRQAGDSSLRGRGRLSALVSFFLRGGTVAWAAYHYAGRLHRLIAQLRPDVIHSNSFKFHLLAGMACLPRQHIVWHLHDFLSSRPLMSRLLRWTSRSIAGAIAVSDAVRRDAAAVLPWLPVLVAPNAVDTEHFIPGPGDGRLLDDLSGLPPAPPETVRVGLVATYARWKGHDIFLDAASRLVHQQPTIPARFYVIGGPIYQTRGSQWSLEELKQRGADLVKAQRLGFVPFQTDPAAAYRALDIVVHASTLPEPFGLTIVEAMACARAVIIAQAGGAAELFRQDEDAVGVNPRDIEGLVRVLSELIANPEKRRQLGENARRTAVSRFHRDRLGGEVLAAYQSFGFAINSL